MGAERSRKLLPLQIGGATIEEDLIKAIDDTAQESLRWTRFISMFRVPFGFWGDTPLTSHWVLARSQLWQAQLEPVQRASAASYGVGLQSLPVVGIFLGKLTMFLNDYPTW